MARSYLPVLLLIGFVALNAALILGLNALALKPRPTATKQQAYESGMAPLGDARERFSVKFYMVAMLFIVFDIETVFMIPWAVHFRQLSCGVPLNMRPPESEYSPSVFSRTTVKSRVPGRASGLWTPRRSRTGRRLTYWSKPRRMGRRSPHRETWSGTVGQPTAPR